ncbi:MAG: hypothetical protein RJA47_2043 [Actinomycetota bacterium]|jgi:murein DD-endopeptidase MepM/ murein hydrolase activator NlpD
MLIRLAALFQFCVVPPPHAVLPGPVVRPYVAPACERCAGHRGVTVAVAGPVRAIVHGVVTFDGPVGNRRFTVLQIGPDLRLTYGDLAGERWERGTVVSRGTVLGTAAGVMYLGVRRAGRPVDPGLVVGRPGARLVLPASLSCPEAPFWPAGLPR